MRKPEKTQEISEFNFFVISLNMEKNQKNRRDCLSMTNLKIPLYCTTRKFEKTRVILHFLVVQKSEKLNFCLFVFSEFRYCKKVELPEPTTNYAPINVSPKNPRIGGVIGLGVGI